ncbi:MAG TPA: hypothetical protein VIV60_13010, partial [Polyangiaceae bacterium]
TLEANETSNLSTLFVARGSGVEDVHPPTAKQHQRQVSRIIVRVRLSRVSPHRANQMLSS